VTWELTGVPYTSAREPGGIANSIEVLRGFGLAERLGAHGVEDAGDLELLPPSGERGPSGILNEAAFERLLETTQARVREAHGRGRRPLLVGGDCPVLLGGLAALDGERGLVMLDGHEDAWPPPLSETGEASDCELGLALGLFPENMPAPLDRWGALLGPSSVALLGSRDKDEIVAGGARSIADDLAFFCDEQALQDGGDTRMADALAAVEADAFWLHLDLDVLSSAAFAAVDYPQPGGLGWAQLESLASAAAGDSRCRGMSVVIYNPDLDPDKSAARDLIDFVSGLIPAA
jgi:arginase